MTDAQVMAIIAAIFMASPKFKKWHEPEELIAGAFTMLMLAKQYTTKGNA